MTNPTSNTLCGSACAATYGPAATRSFFAHNGVEALERLNEDQEIVMVLTDINMPQMDGLTLLEQIPKVDPNIRSVIVSAYGDMQNIRTAMNRGAFDFVTKPIDFRDLRVTIDRTLHHLTLWREALASRDKLVALQNELHVAHQMQQSILPTSFPESAGCQVFGSMEPAREVGGDFFDVINLENGCIGLAIGDVSDKGVPAALFMMSSRTLLKGAAIGAPAPAKVLSEVNQLLEQDNEATLFVTMFLRGVRPGERQAGICQRRAQSPAHCPCGRSFNPATSNRRDRLGCDARPRLRAEHGRIVARR